MSSIHEFEQTVTDKVVSGLHRRFATYARAGIAAADLGDPDQFASRVLAAVPTPHPWDAQFGPFYDTAGVVKLLGITRQAVADRVRRRTLIGASTTSGRMVYPVFQFDGNRVDRRISAISTLFRDTPVTGWAVAAWLSTASPDLGMLSPVDWVRAGKDRDRITELATVTARQWTE